MDSLVIRAASTFLSSRGLDWGTVKEEHPYFLVRGKSRKSNLITPEIAQMQELPSQWWIPITYQGIEIGNLRSPDSVKRFRCNVHFATEDYAIEATPYDLGRLRHIKTSEIGKRKASLDCIDLNSEDHRVWRKKKRGGPNTLTHLGLQIIDDRHFKRPDQFPLYDPRLDGTLYVGSVNEALSTAREIFPEDKRAGQFIPDGAFGSPTANLWLWANAETYKTLKARRGSMSGINIKSR